MIALQMNHKRYSSENKSLILLQTNSLIPNMTQNLGIRNDAALNVNRTRKHGDLKFKNKYDTPIRIKQLLTVNFRSGRRSLKSSVLTAILSVSLTKAVTLISILACSIFSSIWQYSSPFTSIVTGFPIKSSTYTYSYKHSYPAKDNAIFYKYIVHTNEF